MNIIIVTQARIGSSRLPNKVMLKIAGRTMLSLHLYRLSKSKRATKIIVATTNEEGIDAILNECLDSGIDYYQGSLTDVLDRYYQTALSFNADIIVRVTSDCPLIDADLVDNLIDKLIEENVDYCSNTLTEDFPDGQDVEVFTFQALEHTWREAKLNSDREHVTPFIKKNSDINGGHLFKALDIQCIKNLNSIRMTVDEDLDLEVVRLLTSKLGIDASWEIYANYIENNESLITNKGILRNAGYLKSKTND